LHGHLNGNYKGVIFMDSIFNESMSESEALRAYLMEDSKCETNEEKEKLFNEFSRFDELIYKRDMELIKSGWRLQ